MARLIAFLRAINAGRGRSIKMETLRRVFESLGFSNVESFIASGNIVFETAEQDIPALEKKIEMKLREALGYEVATFLRNEIELAQIASYTPFPQAEMDTEAELNIIFLPGALDENTYQKVMALKTGMDEFCVLGSEIY